MRGGAIPLLVWALVLAVLYALNVVWTGKALDAAMAGFAVAATIGTAVALVALRPREALRRGPPPPSEEPEAVPSASYGAVLLAVGVAAMLFGFSFAHFVVYFGAGLIIASLGIIAREEYAQRRALRRWRREDHA
jgi:archaellum biogenesis protein FlaJ (TadC family)